MPQSSRRPRILLLAIGNPLRGDDGIGHHLAERLQSQPAELQGAVFGGGFTVDYRQQITPELAERIAGEDIVVILDADPNADRPFLSEVGDSGPTAFTLGPSNHSISAEVLAQLLRVLYHWEGRMLLLHLPARDFSPGVGISPESEGVIKQAIALIGSFAGWATGMDSRSAAAGGSTGA